MPYVKWLTPPIVISNTFIFVRDLFVREPY